MAVIIIIADENGNQLEKINAQIKSENWEEECYQIGCTVAKQIASQYLQEIEQKLFDEHDTGSMQEKVRWATVFVS